MGMALDLVNFGFTADTSSLSQAVKDIDALEKQVEQTSNAMSRSGRASKEVVTANKQVANSTKEVTQKLTARQKIEKKQELIAESMAKGLTRSQAQIVASYQMAGKETANLERLLDSLNKQLSISGKTNPFDSMLNPLKRISDELSRARLQAVALSKGFALTEKHARELAQIKVLGEASGSSLKDTQAQEESYLQQAAMAEAIKNSNRSITLEKETQNRVDQQNLTIQRNFSQELEKQQRLRKLSDQGFNKTQGNRIIRAEDAGVDSGQIDALKEEFRIQNEVNASKRKGRQEVDSLTKSYQAFGAIAKAAMKKASDDAKAAANNFQNIEDKIKKARMQLELMKNNKGMGAGTASSIAAFGMQAGVTPAQVAAYASLTKEIDKVGAASRRTTGGLLGLATIARQLIPSIGAIGLAASVAQLARELVLSADAMIQVRARINLVKEAYQDTASITSQLVQISRDNRIELDTTARLYTRLMPALKNYGMGTAEATKITQAFGASLLVSGANTQEAIASTIQFSQAMASGRLAGDEFRSVSEAAPAFLQALADGMGVARTEMKRLSEEQLLTTDVIANAMISQQEILSARARTLPKTLGQVFQEIKIEFALFADEVNKNTQIIDSMKSLLYSLKVVMDALGSVIKGLSSVLTVFDTNLGSVLGTVMQLASAFAIFKLFGAAAKGVKGLSGNLDGATKSAGLLTTALLAITGGLKAMALAARANPIGAAVAAGLFVYTQITKHIDLATKAQEKFVETSKDVNKQFDALPLGLEQSRAALADLEARYPLLAQAAVDALTKIKDEQGNIRELGLPSLTFVDGKPNFGGAFQNLPKEAAEALQATKKTYEQHLEDIRKLDEAEARIKKQYGGGAQLKDELKERREALKKELSQLRQILTTGLETGINASIQGFASDRVKVSGELKTEYELQADELREINNLLREGYALELAKVMVTNRKAVEKDFGVRFDADGKANPSNPNVSPFQAAAAEQMLSDLNKQTKGNQELKDAQDALNKAFKDGAKDKKDQYAEQIKSLTMLNALLSAGVSVEEARMRSAGASLAQARAIIDLQKQIESRENVVSLKEELALEQQKNIVLANRPSAMNAEIEAKVALGLATKQQLDLENQLAAARSFTSYSNEVEDLQEFLNLLSSGLTTKEADLEIERQRLAIKLASEGRTPQEIAEMMNLLDQKKELVKAEQEREKILERIDGFIESSFKLDISDVFGESSKSANQFINVLQEMAKTQEDFNQMKQAGFKDDKQAAAFGKARFKQQIQEVSGLLSATKGFFKEKSKGFKVITALEKVSQAASIALAVESLGVKLGLFQTETLASVAKNGVIAASSAIAAAVSSMVGLPFPLNLAALAATTAAIGALGVSIFGGGGSSGSFAPANEGTGTVFGDKDAKSESIKKSIDTLANIAKVELPITSAMLRSLRNIESSIGGITNLVIRGGSTGQGLASGVKEGNFFNSKTIGNVTNALTSAASVLTLGLSDLLGINKLISGISGAIFGKKKVSVKAQGLLAPDQLLSNISGTSFDLQEFVDVQTKKKSIFGSSTKNRTQTSEASDELSRQFGLVISGFYDSILLAAKPLGKNLDEITKELDGFVVKIGKIDFKGLKGEEIQERLEAVFGQQADLIAQAALAGFEDFQKVGEGYFETVVRLASGVEVARNALQRMRVAAVDFTTVANKQGDVAVEIIRDSLKAFEFSTNGFATGFSQIVDLFDGSAEELVDLVTELRSMQDNLVAAGKAANTLSLFMIKGAGDVERLQSGLSSYFDDFLTESEQAAELTRRMTREFDALGLTVPTSIQGFKDLVNSIDTSTESGQELFGAVIALAPAFKDLEDALAGLLPRGELLSTRFLDLEARFLALGVTMPNTGNELEALIAKLQRTDGSVVDLSNEFGILTQANQRLSTINLDVATKTDLLSARFTAMGLELPKTRQEFDRLILNLRDQHGSSTSLSLAVESLSSEFNALMVSTKNQEAASLAAQLAAQQAASAGQSQATATGSLSNQVRALSSDFYNFQIALAEFGGEAGKAIQGLFEALFSSRSAVSGDIAKITSSDKVTMTPSQISAALGGINTQLPDSSALISAVNQKLGLETRLGQLGGQGGLVGQSQAKQANLSGQLNGVTTSANLNLARYSTLNSAIDKAMALFKPVFDSGTFNRTGNTRPTRNGIGEVVGAPAGFQKNSTYRDGIFDVLGFHKTKRTKDLLRNISNRNNSGQASFEGNSASRIVGGALNQELRTAFKNYNSLTSTATQLQRQLSTEVTKGNLLNSEKLAKEKQLLEVNALVLKEQDTIRLALQEFAIDAEKNVKRIDKLRQETVRYFEAQRQLANLMETSANKLAATLKGIRDAQLSPVELLNQMQSEFQSAYARAQIATGAELATAADELDRLIKPLLDQATLVFASGSEADNIRQFVLGAGDDIVKRLEELKPTGYEEESIALLNQIDATLFVLEESAIQANKLLIAAIDLSRVQTVAELEQITRVLGGSPVDKSNLITPFAKGGAFTNSVVNVPTVAPMAMFGEAGAEAIMPLARGGDGSLGVRIVGGMGSNAAVERNTQETNRQLEALVRLQQAANQKMIEKLSEMEERLEGMEQAERLKASA